MKIDTLELTLVSVNPVSTGHKIGVHTYVKLAQRVWGALAVKLATGSWDTTAGKLTGDVNS